jgi:glycolate oxidase FAD binding subunit
VSTPLSSLGDALGTDWVRLHAPVDFDGKRVAATFTPPDAEHLCDGMRAIAAARLTAIVRGAGLHAELGALPTRADVFISTQGLAGVRALEVAEGVCQVGAGTTLGALHRALEATPWELPLDAPDAATLGGVLAAAVMGPRSHGFGPTRDVVLGLDVVLAGGEHTRCGGRVVKNVTGYDLAKLYVGSIGTLGVIESAWLRLRPRPEVVRALHFEVRDAAAAAERALPIAQHVAVRACGWSAAAASPCVVSVELASDAVSVGSAIETLGLEGAASGGFEALAPALPVGGLRLRIPALPSQQSAVVAALLAAGARCIAFPGLRFVLADFDPGSAADAVFAAGAEASQQGCGPLRCEAAPAEARRGRNVLGMSPIEAKLAHELKAQFDPAGTLAPGRLGEGT